MDRSTLKESLASIATQTYPFIEVVVVNALNKTHSRIDQQGVGFPVKLIETGEPLGRSHAANVGLDNATGKYVLFLDDDDWLYPDHITSLVSALEHSCTARVAYSSVKFTASPQSQEYTVMGESFNPIKLRYGNFIPIHAVLFAKDLLACGCRFDETIDLYEDWDFWLQLSQHASFVHVDNLSAGYRSTGDSGAGPVVGEAAIQRHREKIFEKWRYRWSGADINQLLIFASHAQDKEIIRLEEKVESAGQLCVALNQDLMGRNDRLLALEQHNAQLQKKINANEEYLHELGTLIHEMQTSNSWRMTQPLRNARTRLLASAHRAKRVMFYLSPLVREPRKIGATAQRLQHAWRKGGLTDVKTLIKQLPYEVTYNDVWVNQYRSSFKSGVVDSIHARIRGMDAPPLISILMPTYNTPIEMLESAIDSVVGQLYSNWELCIVDDASPMKHVRLALEKVAAVDERIKVTILDANVGVSAATNRALETAKGRFVVLLDHDDLLEPQALFRVAECVVKHAPDMIYSDEAAISESGQEVISHVHRPAFSPEYLRACPYIVHVVAFRTDLLKSIGGLDPALKISQDYDLILRASEAANKIAHIPEILYLWRQRKASSGNVQKQKVMRTSRGILSRHLERCGEPAEVLDAAQFNYFDIRYALRHDHKVAIIIPTKNHWELVRQCIDSIEKTVKQVSYEIVVVDHASDDPESQLYFSELKARYQVLRYEGLFNFSAINNWAVAHMAGDFTHYLFCNNDIEAVQSGWLERMMELCQRSDVGMVGAKLLYPDRKMIQHAGVCVGMYGIAEHYGKFMDDIRPNGSNHPGYHGTLIANHEVSAVTAACALMRRDAFEQIAGYDEGLAVGFGDVDLCLKTREAGYRILFCPHAVLIHHESFTRGKSLEDPHPEDSQYFVRKWQAVLKQGDPYYNPNLTLQSTQWEAKQPLAFDLNIANRVWLRPTQAVQT